MRQAGKLHAESFQRSGTWTKQIRKLHKLQGLKISSSPILFEENAKRMGEEFHCLWDGKAGGLLVLAGGDLIEQAEELREADGDALRTLDERFALGPQSCYAEGHGDAVVVSGIDGCAMQRLASGDIESIFELFDLGAHGAQILDDQSDAVGLLDAQLLRVADANAAARIGRDGRQDGQLVDELRGQCAADGCLSQTLGGRGDLHRTYQFGVLFFQIENADMRAQSGEHVEQRGAGGVQA